MATPAMALQPNGSGSNGRYPKWAPSIASSLILALVCSGFTWFLTTSSNAAVQENRLKTIESTLPQKANKESVDAFQQEVLRRLDRIEQKVDKRR